MKRESIRTSYKLKISKFSILSCYYIKGLGWFRLFGIGVHWKDTSSHGMSFSERNGYKKYFKIGTWHIGFLPKMK